MRGRATKADAQVGKRARAFRLQAKLSQTQVGKAIGVSFQQVQKYENGTNRIAPSKLDGMAKLFNIPVAAFFGNNNDKEETIDVGLIYTRGRARLLTILEQIDDPRYDNKLADMAQFHLSSQKRRN
jgi:transcriptional regulator with XRE-family HTH domain